MILIIDNYDSFTYNLYQTVAQFQSDTRVIRNNKITVSEIRQLQPAGIILSPGPGRPEDAGICMALIQNLALPSQKTIPLLGVCLGHQAISAAFGGKVIQAGEIIHGKQDMIFHHQKTLYHKLPLPFQAGRYHSLIVDRETLPAQLRVEAQNGEGIIMGISHRDLPFYGVQFHPESILTPLGARLLENFVKECV